MFHAGEEIASEPADLPEELGFGRPGDPHNDLGVFGQVEECEVLACINNDMIAVGEHLVLECTAGHPIEFGSIFTEQLHL